MKNYTDIEQSKKLAEILPLESADGFWEFHTEWGGFEDKWEGYEDYPNATPYLEYTRKENEWKEEKQDMPCWSLTPLLEVLSKSLIYTPNQALDRYCCKNIMHDLETYGDNPIDACYEMILKLNELNELWNYD